MDGAQLCRQPFSLCTTAPCERSASNPTIAPCRCVVLDGYSVGYTACEARTHPGRKLVSPFSTWNVISTSDVLTCREQAPWSTCLDMPCEIDPLDPALAT